MLEVIPRLIRSPSRTPSTFRISVGPKCYLVFALRINMIGSCLLRYGYSFKSKNNCCSFYMNKTFYGLTSDVNGLLNHDRSDTHIHNIDAKRYKVDTDSATYLWHVVLVILV